MAQKKDKMLEEYIASPIKKGDVVLVPEKYVKDFDSNDNAKRAVNVKRVEDNKIIFDKDKYGTTIEVPVNIEEVEKDSTYVGANPFIYEQWRRNTRTVNYGIGSIISLLFPELKDKTFIHNTYNGIPIKETNFNPYVLDKDGNKQFYQRPFVWTIEEKQLLIESIYKGLNCGQIIVRNLSEKHINKQIALGDSIIYYRDVVDGKQRINALYEFMTDQFTDLHGNYYSDLSLRAKREFEMSNALTFAEMNEGCTDEDTIAAFLNVNFTGVPQSKEHIEYVENIAKLLK